MEINNPPKLSNWKCYLFGSKPENEGYETCYRPLENDVPSAFVRWMMKICFACTWVYTEPEEPKKLEDFDWEKTNTFKPC